MLVVLDPNVLISAALSPSGAPARLVRLWLGGEFELLVSPTLIAEIERAMAYPKISKRVTAADATALASLLEREAQVEPDPGNRPPIEIEDPDVEYLLALAIEHHAALVSGDRHLRALANRFPVFTPADFLAKLEADLPFA